MLVPAAGGGRLGQPGRHLQPLHRPGHLPRHLHVRQDPQYSHFENIVQFIEQLSIILIIDIAIIDGK